MVTLPKKLSYLLAILLLLSSNSARVLASDLTAFEPEDFKIKRWHFHLSLKRFKVDDPGKGVIIITKNTPEKKIWGGFVRIDRKVIQLHELFRSDEPVLEKEIKLQSRNYHYLFVFLRGTRGASIRIEVRKEGLPPANNAPVTEDRSVSTNEDTPVSVTLTGSDPDGDDLTYSVVSGPNHGILSGTAPNITYSPGSNFNGMDSFTYKATDGNVDSNIAAVSMTVISVNDTPVIASYDPPTPHSVDEGVSQVYSVNAHDDDNESLAYTWTLDGTLVGGDSPSYTYSPDYDAAGSHIIECSVADSATNVGQIWSLTVVDINRAPTAQVDRYNVDEDEVLSVTASGVLANDNDPDGDSLTVELDRDPSDGALTLNSDGSFTYTPDSDFNGQDSFTYTVSDGEGGTDAGTVNITVNPVNDPPAVVSPIPDQNATEDVLFNFSLVSGTFIDVDDDTLNYKAALIGGGPLPTWLGFDGATCIFSGTPINEDVGTIGVIVTAMDSSGAWVADAFAVTIINVNDPPTAEADSVETNEETSVIIPVLDNDTDPDLAHGDMLSASVLNPPGNGLAATNSDNTITYRPNVNFAGNDTFTYTILDAAGESSSAVVTVVVKDINDPPLANVGTYETVFVGDTVFLDGNGSQDVDGDQLSYSWSLSPPTGSAAILSDASLANPYFMADVMGSYTVHLTVNDGQVDSAPDSATIIVEPMPAQVMPQPEGSFGEQYEDLIPYDVSLESYDPKRFSVITGLVQEPGGSPLAHVSVTILNHPEYGTAYTDAEGRFSIPVEGGAALTVVYERKGLITAQRKVSTPWNDIAIAETVQMIPEDTVSTTFTFDGNPENVVTHHSTIVTTQVNGEEEGRSCTMVFTGDNMAYAVDAQGNETPLETITTKATEFPTPESMPAILPPISAFTYCAELSVDGAQRVKFAKPVIIWVDNFLGFDTGESVPVGYYDRDRGIWVPSENGVVVQLLDTDADRIVDHFDAGGVVNPDGTPIPEGSVEGLNDPERYKPGDTFWRVEVSHFSPIDLNWAYGPPPDAIPPNPSGDPVANQQKERGKDCQAYTSSFVEERSGIFHEDVPIPGTDITLHYASNRVKGYKTVISVPASGQTVPNSLKQIIVRAEVAGKAFEQVFDRSSGPLENLRAQFTWDGLDHLGGEVHGLTNARVNVGFVYPTFYMSGGNLQRAFAQAGSMVTRVPARQDLVSWRRSVLLIQPAGDSAGTIAEGWTLSNHHSFSPMAPSTLYKGDGTLLKNNAPIIDTVVGNGNWGFGGDGGPGVDAELTTPWKVAFDPAGNYYITDYESHRLRKVDRNGIITTIAGNGTPGYNGDDILAKDALLNSPWETAVDAAGNLYISDTFNHRIRKIDTSGTITTIAGTGVEGFSGDGRPATEAELYGPQGIDVDAEGNIYVVDLGNNRIRKIDTSGYIQTVVGTGQEGYSGDGGPATQAKLWYPSGLAVDPAGNIYIGDQGYSIIRKVDTNGIITTVAGDPDVTWGYSGDGGPATEATLSQAKGIDVDVEGNIYFADTYNNCIRKVGTNGIIRTIAGIGGEYEWGFSGDGGPATRALLNWPTGVALDHYGNIFIADTYNYRIRKIASPPEFSPVLAGGDTLFAEASGVGYIMSGSGRHERTIDLDTGVVLYEFGYSADGHLVTITDRFGTRTVIERDGNGMPRAIISPDGIRTDLSIDSNNHLTYIVYPDDAYYEFEYDQDGLMKGKIEPNGNRYDHLFDATGRLTNAMDGEGGNWHYSRIAHENGETVTEITTALNNTTFYRDSTDSVGAYLSSIIDPTGAITEFYESAEGMIVNKSLPCGMALEFQYGIDPEYKFKYMKEIRETTPLALEKVTLRENGYQDTNSDHVPDLITETVTVNGNAKTFENDILQFQKTITSPEGRTLTILYDPTTLLKTSLCIPGLYDTTYGYNAKGRLTSISTNTRQTTFVYDNEGFLESITDPENQTTSYSYDSVGRITTMNRPDGSSIGFTYDGNGNMTVLTNPSTINHTFAYNLVNLNNSYQAPLSGNYSYLYDKDRHLTQIIFPSGHLINNIYHKTRLVQIQTPEGHIDLSYLCGTKVRSISKGMESITYGYDGPLVTSETLSGTLNQSIYYGYNNDFNPQSISYAGDTHLYTYDNDGLLTGAGNYAIARNTGNGLPETISGGRLHLSRTFNGYPEVESQNFVVNGLSLTSWSLTRDANGRITQKTETVGGTPSNYTYTYDPMGRLLTVTKDGAVVEEYEYGPNGTRTYEMNTLRGLPGRTFSYSDEDHLLTAGDVTYQYDLDGFLTTKTVGTETTTFDYSSRGELLSAMLPDGRIVDYIHDPLGRRIAKKIDGVITEKYLWQGLTRLLAVYDGNNSLRMRFEYADGRMPVAMTKGGLTYYLVYDQIGSLRVVADASGNVVKSLQYDSSGNVVKDSDPSYEVPFGFAGGLHDRETGLVRFGLRDYDPETGRWTAKDPIFFEGGDTDLYGYCMNDPVSWLDPLGLKLTTAQQIGVSIASGAGALVGTLAIGATTWGVGAPVGAAVGASLFGAAAASLMGGDLADVGLAAISGISVGYIGASIGNLMSAISTTAIQAAIHTGIMVGTIEALLLGSEPVFSSEKDRVSPCP